EDVRRVRIVRREDRERQADDERERGRHHVHPPSGGFFRALRASSENPPDAAAKLPPNITGLNSPPSIGVAIAAANPSSPSTFSTRGVHASSCAPSPVRVEGSSLSDMHSGSPLPADATDRRHDQILPAPQVAKYGGLSGPF